MPTCSDRLESGTSGRIFEEGPLRSEVPGLARAVRVRIRVKAPCEGSCGSKSKRTDVGELLKERVVFLLGLEDKFSCIRAFPAGQLPSCSIPLVTLGDCFGQNMVEVELGNPTVPIRSVVEFDACWGASQVHHCMTPLD